MQGKPLVVQSTQTNEIAAAVQAGNADILTLWAAVERYALKRANRWDKAFQGRYGITLDDLRQTAFIALAKAVELWNQERGGFIGAYELQLKSFFSELYRQRSKRNTRVYAKKQLTWFKRDAEVLWVNLDEQQQPAVPEAGGMTVS